MKSVTSAEFDSEVLQSKQPVLVDFYTDSCPPCRMMSPVLEELEAEAGDQIKVVKIDAGTEVDLASRFEIRAVPAFFAFRNGTCVGQTTGMKSNASMRKWLEDSIGATA